MPISNIRDRIRSIGLNTGYQVGAQIAPACAAVISIPVLLRHLGPESFGIMSIFSTALMYFAMLDLGLGRAATRFISQSLEGERWEDMRRYFWGSVLMLNAMGAVFTVVSMLAVPVVVSRLLKIPPSQVHVTIQSFYLICLAIPLVCLMATFRGFLEAWGKFAFISVVTGCGGVALYALPALAVVKGVGLFGIAAVLVLVRVTMCAAYALGCLAVKGRPSLRPAFDREAVRQMLRFGGWLSVSNIVGTAVIYGDRFLLGITVGMTAVTTYAMPSDVIGKIQILITSFCAVLFPLMSRLDKSGSAQFQTYYRGAVAVSLSLMTPLVLTLVLASPFLMRVWLGARNSHELVFIAQVFLAGAIVQATASLAFTALHARGRSDLPAWAHMAELPLYAVAFYFGAVHFGATGAAVVWLGRVIIDFVCMAIFLHYHDKRSLALPPELTAVVIAVAILLVARLSPARAGIITGGIICMLTWLWTWRTLVDPTIRNPFQRLFLRQGKPAMTTILTSKRGQFPGA
jgi:O-antigen/teichoic acid export membrane protein